LRRAALVLLFFCACGGPSAPPRVVAEAVAPKPVTAPPLQVVDDGASRVGGDVSPIELALTSSRYCLRLEGIIHCSKSSGPDGPLADAPRIEGIDDATSIALSRGDFGCATTRRGTVHCWGSNNWGQLGASLRDERSEKPVQVSGITTARKVFAADGHACALLTEGSLRCWGRNDGGETGGSTSYAPGARELVEPTPVKDVSDVLTVGVAYGSTCALSRGGKVACWGAPITHEMMSKNGYGNENAFELTQVARADDIAVASGILCATSGGEIHCYGQNSSLVQGTENKPIPDIRGATKVRIGGSHACALTRDSKVWCWGYDSGGVLGLPEDPQHAYEAHAPVAMSFPSARDIALSDQMTCAVVSLDEVYCVGTWPYNGATPNVRVERTPVRIAVR